MSRSLNVTLILSGSVAAYKACELASRLAKAGHAVQTVASEGALRFVGAASLEALSGRPVHSDLWARRESLQHIGLREWSDLFVFYPATANRINALAAGLAPDLIGAIFLANNFKKPFWIAPAMNSGMLAHPATQDGLRRLADWGCRIVLGDEGRLACGDVGAGRLAEPAALAELVAAYAAAPPPGAADSSASPSPPPPPAAADQPPPEAADASAAPRLLLTGGAMSEPLDAVRAITNSSSGATALAVAAAFRAAGWAIDFVHYDGIPAAELRALAAAGGPALGLHPYRSYADFAAALDRLLAERGYDAVVHAAAVSDYSPAPLAGADPNLGAGQGKLESGEAVTLRLEPNPKLLPTIRPRLRPARTAAPGAAPARPPIAAFKLTVGADPAHGAERCRRFVAGGQAELAVWNDLAAIKARGGHPYVIHGAAGPLAQGDGNAALAADLLRQIQALALLPAAAGAPAAAPEPASRQGDHP